MSLQKELLSDIRVFPANDTGRIWHYAVAGVTARDRGYPSRQAAFRAAVRAIKRREQKRLRQSLENR